MSKLNQSVFFQSKWLRSMRIAVRRVLVLSLLANATMVPLPLRGEETAPRREKKGLGFIPSAFRSEDLVPWAADLATARQMAAQRGQLVLMHFYATDCPPCKKLEKRVFTDREFAQYVSTQFVPVKINAKDFPDLALHYQVHQWPSDVITTPDGQVVERSVSPKDKRDYLLMLQRTALHANAPRPPYPNQPTATTGIGLAQYPSSASAAVAAPLAAGVAASGTTYPRYSPNLAGVAPQSQPPAAAVGVPPASLVPPPPLATSVAPVSAVAAAPAGPPAMPMTSPPPVAPLAEEAGPPAFPPAMTTAGPPAMTDEPPSVTANGAPAMSPVAPPVAAVPPMAAMTAGMGEMHNPYATRPTNAGPSPLAAAPATSAGLPPQAAPTAPAPPTTDLAATASPANGPAPAPSGPANAGDSATVGLDGFCPVVLVEQWKWVHGDPRFGAVHRGRTYLFSTQEAQQRFLQDPDRFGPALSGLDPVQFADGGQRVEGHRKHGVLYRNQIYLFSSEESLQRFWDAPTRYSDVVHQAMHGAAASGSTLR